MIANSSKLETRPPTVFTTTSLIVISLYGLVLAVPVLISFMIVSVQHFGLLTFLVPAAAIVLSIFLLPLGFGNPYVCRLVRSLEPPGESQLVQVTRDPRQRGGLFAVLEDADDFGFLKLTETALVFDGDSIRLSVPYNRVRNLKRQNTGWRSLFAYGAQTSLLVSDLPEAGRFVFAERSSWILPTSRKNAQRMYKSLRKKVEESTSSPREQ